MPGNGKQQRNGGGFSSSSNSSSDKVEVLRRVKMERGDGNGDESMMYPERPGEPDCIYYLRTGTCGYGTNCRFNHPSNGNGNGGGRGGEQVYGFKNGTELPERAGQPDCGFYMKTGTCKYGSTCKYHHPKERQADSLVLLNVLGLPMRQDAKPCLYYMRTGQCKYGYACKFHHPQPTTTANVLPVPVYGSGGSAIVPSSNAPSVGELSAAASLSEAPYFSGSLLQLPQSYMPLMLSPSQGWNTYVGSNLSPMSVSTVLTAPASNGQLSASHLPERPDQPECRYFMNHGSCKYGPDCKYNHPREKISQLAPNSLGPLGLPLRPGLPICSYYSYYGLCKYGPTCRFDHPLDGFTYAYPMNLPPLASSYSPVTPYQRTPSFVLPSSETSPSKSSNINDWIKKGATTSNKNQHPNNAKSLGDSPDQLDSPPPSSKPSSELVHNESD